MDCWIVYMIFKLIYSFFIEFLILDDVVDFIGLNILFWMVEIIVRELGYDGYIVEKIG